MTLVASNEVAFARAAICKNCEFLFQPTWTCKKCGCFMMIKVRVPGVSCPLPEPKWGPVA